MSRYNYIYWWRLLWHTKVVKPLIWIITHATYKVQNKFRFRELRVIVGLWKWTAHSSNISLHFFSSSFMVRVLHNCVVPKEHLSLACTFLKKHTKEVHQRSVHGNVSVIQLFSKGFLRTFNVPFGNKVCKYEKSTSDNYAMGIIQLFETNFELITSQSIRVQVTTHVQKSCNKIHMRMRANTQN